MGKFIAKKCESRPQKQYKKRNYFPQIMLILLVWVAALLAALTLYCRQVYSKFSKFGVKNSPPIPFIGNMAPILLRKEHFGNDMSNLYKEFPNEKFVGRYEFVTAVILIRDLDLLKKLTVKDFEHFIDHRSMFSETDSFFSRSLFSMKGQEWKDMRSTLSPAFTSSKIRLMVPFMIEVGEQMMISLKEKIHSSIEGFIDVEAKELTSRYANDVIASCAFGLKVNSHKDEDNQFYTMGKTTTAFGFREMMLFFIASNAPSIAKLEFLISTYLRSTGNIDLSEIIGNFYHTYRIDKHKYRRYINPHYRRVQHSHVIYFKLTLYDFYLYFGKIIYIPGHRLFKLDFMKNSTKLFFKNLVLDTMKDREKYNIIRPDMIHLLMEAKKGKLSHDKIKSDDETAGFATVQESSVGVKEVFREWSEDDLIAQAVLFFVAGFDTVSTTMSFLLHELALNPDVQEKLAKEIKDFDVKNDGKFDLKSIQEMQYLDMVVSELLRMWPPALLLERICTKDYNLGKPNDSAINDFIIRKGTSVLIPAYAIHRDPQYYPNPDKFDPERFSELNKHKINSSAYMPFGVGPRNCIGSRFALCEVKVMIYQMLLHIEVSPCEKTCVPTKLSTGTFNVQIEGGHWLRLRLRN